MKMKLMFRKKLAQNRPQKNICLCHYANFHVPLHVESRMVCGNAEKYAEISMYPPALHCKGTWKFPCTYMRNIHAALKSFTVINASDSELDVADIAKTYNIREKLF